VVGWKRQARTGRGIHGLPKVSPGPAMPNPYTPCGRVTPQTALRPFWGWPALRAGGLGLSSPPLDTPSRKGLGRGNSWKRGVEEVILLKGVVT
jgi:hypothetical protein